MAVAPLRRLILVTGEGRLAVRFWAYAIVAHGQVKVPHVGWSMPLLVLTNICCWLSWPHVGTVIVPVEGSVMTGRPGSPARVTWAVYLVPIGKLAASSEVVPAR